MPKISETKVKKNLIGYRFGRKFMDGMKNKWGPSISQEKAKAVLAKEISHKSDKQRQEVYKDYGQNLNQRKNIDNIFNPQETKTPEEIKRQKKVNIRLLRRQRNQDDPNDPISKLTRERTRGVSVADKTKQRQAQRVEDRLSGIHDAQSPEHGASALEGDPEQSTFANQPSSGLVSGNESAVGLTGQGLDQDKERGKLGSDNSNNSDKGPKSPPASSPPSPSSRIDLAT